MESNDDAMDQGSDGGASPLRDNDLLDFDDEGGAQVAPAVNPNLLRAQAANGPMPKPNATGAGVGPLLPPPSVTMRQVTEGTEAAAMLGVISIAAPAVAAPAAPAADASAPAPPPADADATVASEKDGEGETTDSDDSEPDERTDEQKESDNFRAAVFAEIKRVEDAGYRFPSASKWDSVVAYLNNKVLFDADGTDITDCATKKKIGRVAVTEKISELRKAEAEAEKAAAEAQQVVVAGGESQYEFGSDCTDNEAEEEEEESEDEDWTQWEGLTVTQLAVKIGEAKTDVALKIEEQKTGPVKAVLKIYQKELMEKKVTQPYPNPNPNPNPSPKPKPNPKQKVVGRPEYETLKDENTAVKDDFTGNFRSLGYNMRQYTMFSDMIIAEVKKASLPIEIKAGEKKVRGLEAARTALNSANNAAKEEAQRVKQVTLAPSP